MTATEATPAEPFDPNAVALDDSVLLLEASAGTGKTFALAHLVLRLLVERRLGLRQLLVVTYTNAAAAELRDRIGRRIQEALTGLQPPPTGGHPTRFWSNGWSASPLRTAPAARCRACCCWPSKSSTPPTSPPSMASASARCGARPWRPPDPRN